MRDRNHQKQAWLDKDFVNILKEIKQERINIGLRVNLGEISRELCENKDFINLLNQIKKGCNKRK